MIKNTRIGSRLSEAAFEVYTSPKGYEVWFLGRRVAAVQANIEPRLRAAEARMRGERLVEDALQGEDYAAAATLLEAAVSVQCLRSHEAGYMLELRVGDDGALERFGTFQQLTKYLRDLKVGKVISWYGTKCDTEEFHGDDAIDCVWRNTEQPQEPPRSLSAHEMIYINRQLEGPAPAAETPADTDKTLTPLLLAAGGGEGPRFSAAHMLLCCMQATWRWHQFPCEPYSDKAAIEIAINELLDYADTADMIVTHGGRSLLPAGCKVEVQKGP